MMRIVAIALALFLASHIAAQVHAVEVAQAVKVTAGWARAQPLAGRPIALFMTIENPAAAADALLAVKTALAGEAVIHNHQQHGQPGETGNQHITALGRLEIAPGAKLVLRPGGQHLLLLGSPQPLAEGSAFTVTLVFEKSGEINLPVRVGAIAAQQDP